FGQGETELRDDNGSRSGGKAVAPPGGSRLGRVGVRHRRVSSGFISALSGSPLRRPNIGDQRPEASNPSFRSPAVRGSLRTLASPPQWNVKDPAARVARRSSLPWYQVLRPSGSSVNRKASWNFE